MDTETNESKTEEELKNERSRRIMERFLRSQGCTGTYEEMCKKIDEESEANNHYTPREARRIIRDIEDYDLPIYAERSTSELVTYTKAEAIEAVKRRTKGELKLKDRKTRKEIRCYFRWCHRGIFTVYRIAETGFLKLFRII